MSYRTRELEPRLKKTKESKINTLVEYRAPLCGMWNLLNPLLESHIQLQRQSACAEAGACMRF